MRKKRNRQNRLLKRGAALLLLFCLCAAGTVYAAEGKAEEGKSPLLLAADIALGQTRLTAEGFTAAVDWSRPARYGRQYLFRAVLTNGGTDFTGRIEWILRSSEGDPISYQQEFALAAGDTQTVLMPIPLYCYTDQITVRLAKKDGTVLAQEALGLKPFVMENRALVAVLADEERLFDGAFGSLWYSFPAERLPERAEGLDAFDLLYIKEEELDGLNGAQKKALSEFVRMGGTLMLTSGVLEKNHALLSSLFGDIAAEGSGQPLPMLSSTQLAELKQAAFLYEKERAAFSSHLLDDLNPCYLGAAMRIDEAEYKETALFSTRKSSDAETSVPEIENAVHELPYGDGMLGIIPYAVEFTGQEEAAAPLYLLYRLFDGVKKEELQADYGWNKRNSLCYMVSAPEKGSAPELLPLAAVLVLYVLLIGPGLYFLLRFRKKQSRLWGTVTALAFAGAAVVIGLGTGTRVKRPYIRYLLISETDREGNSETEGVISFAAPTNEKAVVSLKTGATVTSGRWNINRYKEPALKAGQPLIGRAANGYTHAVRYETDGTAELELCGTTAFTEVPYFVTYESKETLVATAAFAVTEEGISGAAYSNTETLAEAFVYDNGFLCRLSQEEEAEPELKPKESCFLVGGLVYEEEAKTLIYGGEEVPAKARDYRKEMLLNYCVERLKGREEPYVICFLDTKEAENALFPTEEDGYEAELLFDIVLQQAERLQAEEERFVPYMEAAQIQEGGADDGYITSLPLVADYLLPKGEQVTELIYAEAMNSAYNYSTGVGFDGDIFFYNWDTGAYDLAFSGTGYGSVRQTAPYLNEEGRLRVRCTKGRGYQSAGMTMPHLSYRISAPEEGGKNGGN